MYVCKALYMHICPAYMHIWQYILLRTVYTAYIYIYIYIYIQCKTLNNYAKPLTLQEAAVSIALRYNKVLQKLLKVSINKQLNSAGTV